MRVLLKRRVVAADNPTLACCDFLGKLIAHSGSAYMRVGVFREGSSISSAKCRLYFYLKLLVCCKTYHFLIFWPFLVIGFKLVYTNSGSVQIEEWKQCNLLDVFNL